MAKKVGIVIVALVVAGGLFYGGFAYGKSQASSSRLGRSGTASSFGTGRTGSGATGTAGAARGAGGFAGGASGTILSINGLTFTIGLPSGSSQIVVVASSTPVLETTETSSASLNVGDTVTVSGTTNTDGSLTAQSISIRPATSTPTQTPTTAQ